MSTQVTDTVISVEGILSAAVASAAEEGAPSVLSTLLLTVKFYEGRNKAARIAIDQVRYLRKLLEDQLIINKLAVREANRSGTTAEVSDLSKKINTARELLNNYTEDLKAYRKTRFEDITVLRASVGALRQYYIETESE